jgi:hypothetical protein
MRPSLARRAYRDIAFAALSPLDARQAPPSRPHYRTLAARRCKRVALRAVTRGNRRLHNPPTEARSVRSGRNAHFLDARGRQFSSRIGPTGPWSSTAADGLCSPSSGPGFFRGRGRCRWALRESLGPRCSGDCQLDLITVAFARRSPFPSSLAAISIKDVPRVVLAWAASCI